MKLYVPLLAVGALVAVNAGAQMIEIDFVPKLGEAGSAEGRVVWSGLNAGNMGDFAVIAMLDNGGTEQYVKPMWEDYLTPVDVNGNFRVNITTHVNDYGADNYHFYFVERSVFSGVYGDIVKLGYMNGKYLAVVSVSRTTFWADMMPEPAPGVPPGFVLAGTSVGLSCTAGDTIHFTTNGMPAAASSPVYTGAFSVPSEGALIIHAVAVRDNTGAVSPPVSFIYLPRKPLDKPFFGLGVSLILGNEEPGGLLSEADTRTRLQPFAPLTQWVRTFGTLNNGHEYINRIAQTELGLRTLVGVWISTNATETTAQLNGLKAILAQGPAPDLIAVGNECSLTGVPAGVLASAVAAVRSVLADYGLGASVPVGSVDIGGADWSRTVLNQLDFVGVNLYCGTWDATPENQMAAATAQSYTNEVQRLGKRMVLLTETGTPHAGGTYSPPAGGSQTASETKAAAYLNAMLDWTRNDRIPLFYFSAYDEAWKSRGSGHPIEEYFGVLGANGILHPFYVPVLSNHRPPTRIDGIAVTPSAVELSWLDGNANCVIRAKTNLTDAAWIPLRHAVPGAGGIQFLLPDFGFRFFYRTPMD